MAHNNLLRTGLLFLGLLAVLSVPTASLRAQGCSDAGACSLGAIRAASQPDSLRNRIRLAQGLGLGEENVLLLSTELEANLGLAPWLQLQAKLPFQVALGDEQIAGLGDAQAALSFRLLNKERAGTPTHQLWAVVGLRLPTGNGNRRSPDADTALPMVYQPSLGSWEAIAGLRWQWKNWGLGLAWQQVLSQNSNAFGFADFDPDDRPFQSRRLRRGNDAVLSLDHRFSLTRNRLLLVPGLLFIYHTNPDEIEDARGQRFGINESVGATLNLTLQAQWAFSARWALDARLGAPLLVREYRTDGLTRSAVLQLGLNYRL